MKKSFFFFLMVFALEVVVVAQAMGQRNRVHFSRTHAHRVGLKQRWSMQLASGRGGLRDVAQFVSSQTRVLLHEINYGDRKLLISEHDVDRFGNPLGRDGSARSAQRQLIRVQEAGWGAKLTADLVPEVMLYAVTRDAAIHAVDAQTGRVRWTTVVGNSNYPSFRPGVSEKYVAVVNGSTLYLLRRSTGEVFWSRAMTGVPAFGPVLAGSRVYTLAQDGLVESFQLEDLEKASWSYHSSGNATSPLAVSTSTVCWMTDKGYLFVRNMTEGGLRYRFEATDNFPASPAFHYPNRLYAAAADGFVYCLDEKTGKTHWRFSVGQAIEHGPVAVGDAVYVLPDDGGMFQLESESGEPNWRVPRIRSFLAASDGRVYCVDENQRMSVIDTKSGATLGSASMRGMDFHITNFQTDRIFMGNSQGSLQCLHEPHLDTPIVHIHLKAFQEDKESKPDMPKSASTTEENEAESGGDDPLDRGDGDEDPFGGGDDEDPFGGEDGVDPFGDGEDAFGSGDEEDPFGSDDDEDPFGG